MTLGTKRLESDATLTAPTDFTTNQLSSGELSLSFRVEEEEMLVDLEMSVTYSHTVDATPSDFTLFVDGADVETVGTNGLVRHTPAAAADENTVYMSRTVRLDQGLHTVELRAQTAANDIVLEGGTVPCSVVARRHSHPATLGHGVDAKTILVQ